MTVLVSDPDLTLYVGDALEVLRGLPSGSVNCCVTSPPYWGLRDYGTGLWDGGDPECDHLAPPGGGFQNSTLEKQRDVTEAAERVVSDRRQQFRDVCGKCGATRVDRQLGLEATPELFVAGMVEVFREVRRVLAEDATLWLNLGDSFADKQLAGMPWRVAFALQQPYYTGKIASENDRTWLAAMVDAEGSIGINWQRGGEHRPNDIYSVSVKVHNCSEAIVRRCAAIAGVGSVALAETRRRPVFAWSVYGATARALLRELYPHLVAKQHEARLAYANESCIGDAAKARYEALRLLHRGSETLVDEPAPPSCLEPGWYLRSDIIWSKPNPMPESVTDRPTKAHEYVFLLSKGPRYWFDQEAVREPAQYGFSPTTNGKFAASVGGKHGSHTVVPGNGEGGRNLRSVWEIATQPYSGAHFATFPEALVERCLKAGCPEWVCGTCGKPRERIVETTGEWRAQHERPAKHNGEIYRTNPGGGIAGANVTRNRMEVGWSDCGHGNYQPGTVLDPFGGSGTTALVARRHGRKAVLIELNPEYARLAAVRCQQLSLLAEATQ